MRPWRLAIKDSLGRERSLGSGRQAFSRLSWSLGEGALLPPVLLFGLGPEVEVPTEMFAGREVFWLECPDFQWQLDVARAGQPPAALPFAWIQLDPANISQLGSLRPEIWIYTQNEQLFPEFWGPLLAQARLSYLRNTSTQLGPRPEKSVLLTGNHLQLLHLELTCAFRELGYRVLCLPSAEDGTPVEFTVISEFIAETSPDFCLAVNLYNVDADGCLFHFLQAAKIPLIIWLVDNPWHILSALRLSWWKGAHLCVTDKSFIPGLLSHGAHSVTHLPLGCSSLSKPVQGQEFGPQLLFVGSSGFKDLGGFFAASRKTTPLFESLLSTAQAMLEAWPALGIPDFAWWISQLGMEVLWPGHMVRQAGWGAELSSRLFKVKVLQAAQTCGLEIVGDVGWQALLPGAKIRPPVDYYSQLPALYRQADFTLNVTSLLLPAGLTQRHFDVWQAGGFLLTLPTAGLDIFPADLVSPILIDEIGSICEICSTIGKKIEDKRDLQYAWQNLLCNYHTYTQRMQKLLNILNCLDNKIK